MRLTLGAVLATAALATTAGCGSSTSSASQAAGPVPEAKVRTLFSMTGAGGRVSETALPLTTAGEIKRFAQQFPSALTARRVTHAIAQVDTGGLPLYGAVVAVGCDRPPGVDVLLDGSGDVQIVAHEVASPLPECLAAVTTVALVTIPGSD